MKKSVENKVDKLSELLCDSEVVNCFLEDDNNDDAIRLLISKLYDLDEGNTVLSEANTNQVINHYDERGELYALTEQCLDSLSVSDISNLLSENLSYVPFDNYPSSSNKKVLIEMLGLRDYATREEIINRINEVI